MVLSGEPKCTGTNSQSSGWGVTKACVSSTLGTCGLLSLGQNVTSVCLFCCPPLKSLLAIEFWLVGVAGARNYLPGKNLILPSPPKSPSCRHS